MNVLRSQNLNNDVIVKVHISFPSLCSCLIYECHASTFSMITQMDSLSDKPKESNSACSKATASVCKRVADYSKLLQWVCLLTSFLLYSARLALFAGARFAELPTDLPIYDDTTRVAMPLFQQNSPVLTPQSSTASCGQRGRQQGATLLRSASFHNIFCWKRIKYFCPCVGNVLFFCIVRVGNTLRKRHPKGFI